VSVCVSRRTESGQSVDSLPLSHLLAADSVNYESSDTDYAAVDDEAHTMAAYKVPLHLLLSCVTHVCVCVCVSV